MTSPDRRPVVSDRERHDVVVVGAGPTGLMLAAELALGGVDVVVVERRADQTVSGVRARGLHARSIEILDQRGLADRFLAAGQVAQIAGFAGVIFDLAAFPTRHPWGLALWQQPIERLLAARVVELGVPVLYGVDVAAFVADDDGVDIDLADGRRLRAGFIVGCDGGRSRVRKAAGIAFPGHDPTASNLIAEARFTSEPAQWGIHRDALGIHALTKMDDGRVNILVTERDVTHTGEPTPADLAEALTVVFGNDFGLHDVSTLSRFTDMTRQAVTYRAGRVLIAGDAAHVHAPDGGQGLNLGLQDAVNLGWKLAQVISGTSDDSLLESYTAERHPIAARALRHTMASVALRRADERTNALRETVAELLAMPEPRDRFAATMSGLDIHYDLGAGHPLLGRRVPDVDLVTAAGPRRLFSLLHDAQPVLLNLGASATLDAAPWPRVRVVDARCTSTWAVPVLGPVVAPTALLIRPDGHVAWVGDGSDAGLAAALTRWCGAPRG